MRHFTLYTLASHANVNFWQGFQPAFPGLEWPQQTLYTCAFFEQARVWQWGPASEYARPLRR